jgi:hypothetical protein
MSFHGRESVSSTPVLIHLIDPGGQASHAMLHELMALSPSAYVHVREFGGGDGAPYVITDMHFGPAEFPDWLKRARAADGAKPASAGEFTRLFRPAAVPAAGEEVPTEELPVPVAPAAPGEFTRLFSSPVAPPPSIPPVAQAGDITSLFERKPDAAPDQHGPSASGIVNAFNNIAEPAGSCWSERGSEPFKSEPSQPPPVSSTAPEPGDFTRLLGAVPAASPAPVLPHPAPPPAPAAVSDYTRVIAARPPAAPSMQPAPNAPPQTRRTDVRPIVVFSVLAALAVALILLAALGR